MDNVALSHVDDHNEGIALIAGFGNYGGRDLWVHDPEHSDKLIVIERAESMDKKPLRCPVANS